MTQFGVVPGSHAQVAQLMFDVLREVAAQAGTGHIGSEHVALLAVRGAGGLADLTRRPPHELTTALGTKCRLAVETPVERPHATPRTQRIVRSAIILADLRGSPMPSASELVGALLNEPGCEAWRDLWPLGITERSVEMAQRAAIPATVPPEVPRRAPVWNYRRVGD